MNLSPTSPDPFVADLAALADPARLRLLALVEREELCVGELAEVVQLPQPTVSRHLKALAAQGWVVSRSERTSNRYRFAAGELAAGAVALWEIAREATAGWAALAQDRLRLDRLLAERRPAGSSFFAGAAAEWERLRRELYGDRFTEAALAALLPSHWTVADLACGSGTVAERLAGQVARVVAVDNSPEMLAAARRRLAGRPNVELHEADLARLPVAAESCDAALMLLALTHLDDPAAALAEMARLLRPGGRAVVVDLLRHDREEFRRQLGQRWPGFAPEELAALLATAGLREVRVEPLSPEPEAKGPALLLATASRSTPSDPERPGASPRGERNRA